MSELPTLYNPDWLPLPEAAALLGRSPRTVERLAQANLIQTRSEPRPGRTRAETLYSAADIQKAKRSDNPDNSDNPAIPTKAVTEFPSTVASSTSKWSPAVLKAMQRFNEALTAQRLLREAESPRLTERLYLSLDEAQTLSGLGKAFLLREVKRGRLVACKAPGWRIQRESLETWTPEPED